MKKILIILFILLFTVNSFGAFTESIDDRTTYKHAYRWTGKPKDKLLTWAKEVEDRLTGDSTIEFVYYNPTDIEPAANEGSVYYDLSEHKLKFRNASAWVAIEAGSTGNSLDGAYDVGRAISVDGGTITFTGTDPADNVVLTLVQSDTGTTKGFTITNAGTGNTIDIQGQASSLDIEGTNDSWSVSSIGSYIGVIGTWSGDQTWTGSTANIIIDVSDDELLIEDDAQISFGDAADVTFSWNQTNLLIEAATDNVGQIQIGATNSMDLKILGSTNTDIALFDASAGALLLDSYPIALGDGDSILFGDTLGTGDFSITDTSDVLVITNVVDGTGTVGFGTAGAGIDVTFHGDAGSATATWDENQNTNGALVFNNADIELGDADLINFGDSDDFSMTATNLAFTFGTLTSDETSAWNFGANTDGDDVKFFGATTAEFFLWDASADFLQVVGDKALFTMTGTTLPFHVNVTGTVSGDAITLETTSGGIKFLADGGSTGDITLDAEDDIIMITTGSLTVTNTDPMTISGALTVAGVATLNGTIVGDGGDALSGYLKIVTDDNNGKTLNVNESGTVQTNAGASGPAAWTLPAAAIGLEYYFIVGAAQELRVTPVADDSINHAGTDAANAEYYFANAIGEALHIVCIDAATWVVVSETGTWGEESP